MNARNLLVLPAWRWCLQPAKLIQLDNLDLFNSAHMGSVAPRFHHNRFRVEPVFEIMPFAAAALFPRFIGFLAIYSHRPFGNS